MKIKLSILALLATTLFMSCGIPFSAGFGPYNELISDGIPGTSSTGFGPVQILLRLSNLVLISNLLT
jgi:hypothetical protein